MSDQEPTRYELRITGEGEVTKHPNCPVCGEEGCEIVHTATEGEPS